ncbi:MAG: ATP-binding protein [Planctomycetota bacterium]
MTSDWDWTGQTEIASRLGDHLPFLEEVLSHADSLGWEGRDFFGLQMTLEETLTNAIRHGNHCDPEKRVRAECKLTGDRFWLTVEDEGDGFDRDEVADCTADENLDAFGGRGMALIDAYMADVSFNDVGNRITVETTRGYRPPPDEDGSP